MLRMYKSKDHVADYEKYVKEFNSGISKVEFCEAQNDIMMLIDEDHDKLVLLAYGDRSYDNKNVETVTGSYEHHISRFTIKLFESDHRNNATMELIQAFLLEFFADKNDRIIEYTLTGGETINMLQAMKATGFVMKSPPEACIRVPMNGKPIRL